MFPAVNSSTTNLISFGVKAWPSRFFSISEGTCMVRLKISKPRARYCRYDANSKPDWMPRGFHFHAVENPIRILPLTAPAIRVRKRPPRVAFHIEFAPALQDRAELRIPAAVDDGVHIHMAGDVRGELRPLARKQIDNARRQIAGRNNFREGEGGQWLCFGDENEGGVAAQDYRHNERNEREKCRFIGTNDDDNAGRLGGCEVEMRRRGRGYRAQHMRRVSIITP